MINSIYSKLLLEAQSSPMLLSDLAGLETYISESYSNRSFIELLQNADDAQSTKFLVTNIHNFLIIANNGRVFNSTDIESLCRSASSTKVRGESIGYRGIGFKSVVGIANEIHLISGDFQITFSKELTKNIIPNAINVPLIRIPHPIKIDVASKINEDIERLKEKGYTTFFVFSGVDIQEIKDEYLSFKHTALLFLNNILYVDIKLGAEEEHIQLTVNKISENNKQTFINSSKNKSQWDIFTKDNCSIAFYMENNLIKKLTKSEAIIHAFLPTEDCNGLGVIINADFSTDPSRRHLIYNEATIEAIKSIAELYYELFINNITNKNDSSHEYISALIPYFDIRLTKLTKNNFEKYFSSYLESTCGNSFKNFKLPPQWLNLHDYMKINKGKSKYFVNDKIFEIVGFESLIKFLGGTNENISDLLEIIDYAEISIAGYSQIFAECVKKTLMNVDIPLFKKVHIVFSDNIKCSLEELENNNKIIDANFIQLLNEKGVSENDLRICLKKLSLNKILEQQFNSVNTNNVLKETNFSSKISPNVNSYNKTKWTNIFDENISQRNTTFVAPQKWRSAEENTLILLNNRGFNIKDISKQNIGYDLEGFDPNGNSIYIEVKSLDYIGQKFRMTNNEYAVAQYYNEKYYLALVVQSKETIEINLIKDPINKLILNRQCVQWVWECSEYNYNNPLVFNL